MNIGECLLCTTCQFEEAGIVSARLDAEVLISRYLKTTRSELYTHPERSLSIEDLQGFDHWVERRCKREPVAYILGEKEFWSLPFEVSGDVLIPRAETEILVEEVLRVVSHRRPGDFRVLEIGIGSGAISVALATEIARARFIATDLSVSAIAFAARNAVRHGVRDRIAFVVGNLLQPVAGLFDFIVSNPPYIPNHSYSQLPEDVAGYEPAVALLAGEEGTAFHRVLIREGERCLKKGGWLFMEIGSDQKAPVERLFEESNLYDNIVFRRDYGGHDRVAGGRRK